MSEQFANNAQSTLASSLTKSATTLSVASAAKFPTIGEFRLRIDNEILKVTGVSGTTFTVERGQESTEAASHSSGAVVTAIITAALMSSVALNNAPVTLSPSEENVVPLTVRATDNGGQNPMSTAIFRAQDKAKTTILTVVDQDSRSGHNAPAIEFYGTEGHWSVGIDDAVEPFDRDFYIAALYPDNTERDIIYIAHNGGESTESVTLATAPSIRICPAGVHPAEPPSLAVFGRLSGEGDYPMLGVYPTSVLAGDALIVQTYDQSTKELAAHPALGVRKDGRIAWGSGTEVFDVFLKRPEAQWLQVVGSLKADNTLQANLLKSTSTGTGLELNGKALITKGIGLWGHTAPAAKPAKPTTLEGVITILEEYGICA